MWTHLKDENEETIENWIIFVKYADLFALFIKALVMRNINY
jgi:hypothetical protein